MKKRSVIAALLCSLCLTAGGAVPAMADSARVVTLGADLTQDQKDTMMRYFKTDASQVQILTITNQDEREHLGDYIPLEQNKNPELRLCKTYTVRRNQGPYCKSELCNRKYDRQCSFYCRSNQL